MAIQGNMEKVVRSSIDETNKMLLARRKCFEVIRTSTSANILAIDQDGVSSGWTSRCLYSFGDLEKGAVVPISQRNGTQVDVIVCGSRTYSLLMFVQHT
jgi:hypothetical protein